MRARSTFASLVWLASWFGLLAVACQSSQHVKPGDSRVVRDPIAAPINFEPAMVDAYEVPPRQVPKDPAASRVYDQLAEVAKSKGVIHRDPRLDLAATEVAGLVSQGITPSSELVVFTLRAHGVVDTLATSVVLRAGEDLATRLGDVLAGNIRVGLGGSPMIAIVTTKSPVTLGTTPKLVRDELVLEGTLEPHHLNPEVTIAHEDGLSEKAKVTVNHTSFSAQIMCGQHRGPQMISIAADGVLAIQIPLYCNTSPPTSFRVDLDATTTSPDPARRLAAIINRERTNAGLAPLVDDPRVTRAAVHQAEAMRTAKSISHTADSSTPAERVRDAGVVPPVMFESTMKVANLGRVSELLMNEPAYQKPLDSPIATHMGIGIVRDPQGGIYVALVYVQLVAPVDIHAWADDIATHLYASWPHSKLDAPLAELAQKVAGQLSLGWRESSMWSSLDMDVRSQERVFSGKIVRSVSSLDEVDVLTLIGRPDIKISDFGIGVVQSRQEGPQAGRVWVVVLFR